jgi:topoisomerase IA-like protein
LCLSKKSLTIPKGQSETYIEEEQTTQWLKEKVQKDKQRYTKHTYKTKDRVTSGFVALGRHSSL